MRGLPRYLLLLPLATAIGCRNVVSTSFSITGAGPAVVAKGPVKKESRTVGKFSRVKVSDAFDVEVRVGGTPSVTIEAPQDVLSIIDTSVVGDTLRIRNKKSVSYKAPVRVRIVAAKLEGLEMSGASSVKALGAKADRFDLNLTGAGHVELDGQIRDLTIDSAGASAINLKGKADRVNISASGASAIEASTFKAGDVRITCDGASTAKFGALRSLDARADGASQISYRSVSKVKRSEAGGASHIGKE